MRFSAQRSCLLIAAAMVTVLGVSGSAVGESSDAIGRWLAERFAEDSHRSKPVGKSHDVVPAKPPAAADEQRMLEEIEMLERARAEAEARRETPSGIGEVMPATQPAAREAAERRDDEQRIAEERKRAEDAERAAEGERKAAEAELAQMEAEREAEAERIDAVLRKARAAREARDRSPPSPTEGTIPGAAVRGMTGDLQEVRGQVESSSSDRPPALSLPERGSPADERDSSARQRSETRVTVLMTMEPGNRGIRRHNKTADPLLCGEHGCYVGAGADAPAAFLPRRRAFGPGQTLGERAGACRDSLGCVFRSVDLVGYPAVLQPIDMRFLRHDRRQPLVLTETSDCRIDQGRLACTAFHGPDYTMWVVPERIADMAGATELARVIESGLVGGETTAGRTSRD